VAKGHRIATSKIKKVKFEFLQDHHNVLDKGYSWFQYELAGVQWYDFKVVHSSVTYACTHFEVTM
jgi:hypothetical protein